VAWQQNRTASVYPLVLSYPIPNEQIVQLTSLRPTADLFCSLLRDALKLELQRGQMKIVKSFVKTCYSEVLISSSSSATPENEREDGSLIQHSTEGEKDGAAASGNAGNNGAASGGQGVAYHGGLGLKFRFPGDPKKSVHYFFLVASSYQIYIG
jgi:TBC1 domain family member 8/9